MLIQSIGATNALVNKNAVSFGSKRLHGIHHGFFCDSGTTQSRPDKFCGTDAAKDFDVLSTTGRHPSCPTPSQWRRFCFDHHLRDHNPTLHQNMRGYITDGTAHNHLTENIGHNPSFWSDMSINLAHFTAGDLVLLGIAGIGLIMLLINRSGHKSKPEG